jgi:DNA-binding CsgD family transcriptional regulator
LFRIGARRLTSTAVPRDPDLVSTKRTAPTQAAVFTLSDDDDDVVILRLPSRGASLRAKLTDSEIAVVELVCAGLSNAEIAARRRCARRTVANQLASIFKKLSVGSRHELIALVAAAGLENP